MQKVWKLIWCIQDKHKCQLRNNLGCGGNEIVLEIYDFQKKEKTFTIIENVGVDKILKCF